MNFTFLTAAQVAALSDDDRTKYETDLAAYIEYFRTKYPTGTAEITADIEQFGITPRMVNKQPRVAINLDLDDKTFAEALLAKGNTWLVHPKRADVIAQNSGFASFSHMGLTCLSATDKGSFTLEVFLAVKGEAWTGKNSEGIYTSTHLQIRDVTYVVSTEVAGKMGKATEQIAVEGYRQMLNGAAPAQAIAPVALPEEEAAEVNP